MRLEDLPAVPGVVHRFVDGNGVRLHLAEAGSGPPLLLLHGWPQHWWAWRKVIPTLAERWRVLALDLRGWGWSDAPRGLYAKQEHADDVLAFLDSEGIERVTLLGHDWGGYVSYLLATAHPERIERMVTLDIPPPWPPPPRPSMLLAPLALAYQGPIVTPGLGEWLHRSGLLVPLIHRLGSGPDFSFTREEIRAFTEPLREPARARASARTYRTFLLREIGRSGLRADQLTVPTIAIMGGASLIGRIGRPEPTPSLRVETIPRAGHFLAEEAPEETLRLSELMA